MPSEALSVLFLDVYSASSGIDGGTGCNFIYFFDNMQVHRPILRLCCVFFSYYSRIQIIKIRVSSIRTYCTIRPQNSSATIRNDYNIGATMNKESISVLLIALNMPVRNDNSN